MNQWNIKSVESVVAKVVVEKDGVEYMGEIRANNPTTTGINNGSITFDMSGSKTDYEFSIYDSAVI